MTRFARAKGSKASNLKTPEDSTPWEVMKDHMLKAKQENEEAKKREQAEQQRIDNYNNFLKEQKVQKRKATWCDFPEAQPKKPNTNQTNNEQKEKKRKKESTHNGTVEVNNVDINNTSQLQKNENLHKKKKKKNKTTQSENLHSGTAETNNHSNVVNKDLQVVNEKKQKTKNNKKAKVEHIENVSSKDVILNSEENISSVAKKKKKKKPKELQQKLPPNENLTKQVETSSTVHSEAQLVKNKNKKNKAKKNKNSSDDSNIVWHADKNSNDTKTETNSNKINNQPAKKRKNKLKKGEQPNRRKPINDSFQIIINGKEVELVRYDGFPIMKKDAERLDELKQNMIKKGIPKSEVQRTMKLERRRAEKALARVKRDVCYNCRKGGHNLSDCPDLKSNLPGVDAAEGLCFKCGSTEHRQFECKVQRDKEFRFATCFICKESGHIARQCPDNPKGLYPNGGCCKLCGDVTHLRKDCPTVKDKKEESTIKLHTLHDDNIEDIGQNEKAVSQETVKKPKKIKF